MVAARLVCCIAAVLSAGSPVIAETDVNEIGIQSAREITDPNLRALRMRMVKSEPLTYAQLRSLADVGDGLAAFKVAQVLEAEQDPALVDDAIHYYAVAARTGRDFAVRRLVSLLMGGQVTLSEAQLRNVEDALVVQARTGNGIAAQALSDMYLRGQPFGLNEARAYEYLEASAQAGDADAAVRLGMIYMKGSAQVPRDTERARAMLTLAAGSPDLGSRTIAENLLRTLPGAPRPSPVDVQPATSNDPPQAVAVGVVPRARPAGLVTEIAVKASFVVRPRPRPADFVALVQSSTGVTE